MVSKNLDSSGAVTEQIIIDIRSSDETNVRCPERGRASGAGADWAAGGFVLGPDLI